MGIKGIYREIGPGSRISLCKLAVDTLEETGRPLRLAIDVSIWLFQVQAARGGSNPAIRTLFYRLARLLSLSIQAVFVFDGPYKPAFKRNKRSARGEGGAAATAMAKRLIRLFGFVVHDAPGEAEAECALLQRERIVDAVLSEDVDTIMFGCDRTLRNWSAEGSGKTPTHVSVYDSSHSLQLGREGMVLVALMSGGDYIPEGVPGCGVKVACEAASAGFGRSLCRIKRSDQAALAAWKARLLDELRHNKTGFFRTRHKALSIPDDFPNMEVLGYYTHPVVSNQSALEKLRRFPSGPSSGVDVVGLRAFVADTFDWTHRAGAIKFIRVLAPGLLTQKMLAASPAPPAEREFRQDGSQADMTEEQQESTLVTAISKTRAHFSTDATTELRVSFVPSSIVGIDPAGEEDEVLDPFSRGGLALNSDDEFDEVPGSTQGGDAPSKSVYDPSQTEQLWIPETIVKIGLPLTFENWVAAQRSRDVASKAKAAKSATRTTRTARKQPRPDMPVGTLEKYLKVTKPPSMAEFAGASFESSKQRPPPSSAPAYMIPQPSSAPVASSAHPARRLGRVLAATAVPSSAPIFASGQSSNSKPATRTENGATRSSATRTQATRLPPRPAGTNPWTRAGSQSSPRITKPSSAAAAAAEKSHGPASPLQPSACPDPIIILSSPALGPQSPPVPRPRRPKHGRRSRAKEDSFDEDPVGSPSSPRLGSPLASARKHGPPRLSAKTPPRGDHPLLSQPPSTSRRRGLRGHGEQKSKQQQSILNFIELGDGAVLGEQPSPSTLPPKDSRSKTSTSAVGSRPRRLPSLVVLSDDDDDDGGGGFGHRASLLSKKEAKNVTATTFKPPASTVAPQTGPSDATSTAKTNAGTTVLFMPRKNAIGFFAEVEVSRDEADRILRQQQLQLQQKRQQGPRIYRRSEVGIIDLTAED